MTRWVIGCPAVDSSCIRFGGYNSAMVFPPHRVIMLSDFVMSSVMSFVVYISCSLRVRPRGLFIYTLSGHRRERASTAALAIPRIVPKKILCCSTSAKKTENTGGSLRQVGRGFCLCKPGEAMSPFLEQKIPFVNMSVMLTVGRLTVFQKKNE